MDKRTLTLGGLSRSRSLVADQGRFVRAREMVWRLCALLGAVAAAKAAKDTLFAGSAVELLVGDDANSRRHQSRDVPCVH